MSTISVRALRADLAAAVRRSERGEHTVITVSGRPVAQLGPVDDGSGGTVIPPRRTSTWRPPAPVQIWSGVRIDRALGEVR